MNDCFQGFFRGKYFLFPKLQKLTLVNIFVQRLLNLSKNKISFPSNNQFFEYLFGFYFWTDSNRFEVFWQKDLSPKNDLNKISSKVFHLILFLFFLSSKRIFKDINSLIWTPFLIYFSNAISFFKLSLLFSFLNDISYFYSFFILSLHYEVGMNWWKNRESEFNSSIH